MFILGLRILKEVRFRRMSRLTKKMLMQEVIDLIRSMLGTTLAKQ